MEVDKDVPSKLLVKTGADALTKLWLTVLPPPHAIPTPPTCPQSTASSAHTVALAQASLGGEQLLPEQPACGISPNQSRRRSETAPVPPEAASVNLKAAIEATPGPEPDTSKTMAREGETLGDRPRDSLLMYRSRPARRDTTMTSGECQSWLAMTKEQQGVTCRAVTQTAHQGLEEQDPPESTDSIPPVRRTSPGESPDLSFIPEFVLLLPTADVAHQMGAENGALPKLP